MAWDKKRHSTQHQRTGRMQQRKPGDTPLNHGLSGYGSLCGLLLQSCWSACRHAEQYYGICSVWHVPGTTDQEPTSTDAAGTTAGVPFTRACLELT